MAYRGDVESGHFDLIVLARGLPSEVNASVYQNLPLTPRRKTEYNRLHESALFRFFTWRGVKKGTTAALTRGPRVGDQLEGAQTPVLTGPTTAKMKCHLKHVLYEIDGDIQRPVLFDEESIAADDVSRTNTRVQFA